MTSAPSAVRGREDVTKSLLETQPVGNHQIRLGDHLSLLGRGLEVMGVHPDRDQNLDPSFVPDDTGDDVPDDRRRGHHLELVGDRITCRGTPSNHEPE